MRFELAHSLAQVKRTKEDSDETIRTDITLHYDSFRRGDVFYTITHVSTQEKRASVELQNRGAVAISAVGLVFDLKPELR